MNSLLALDGVDAKDPAESKFYNMDWTAYLNSGATISTSTWTVTGLTIVGTPGIVTGGLMTSVQLSGGVAGQDYYATNQVVTSDGETLPRTGLVKVREL